MLCFINISYVIRVLTYSGVEIYIVISGKEYCKNKWCIDCWWFWCVLVLLVGMPHYLGRNLLCWKFPLLINLRYMIVEIFYMLIFDGELWNWKMWKYGTWNMATVPWIKNLVNGQKSQGNIVVVIGWKY